MSLVEDMMGEMNELKELKNLQDEMKALKDMFDNISKQMDDVNNQEFIYYFFKLGGVVVGLWELNVTYHIITTSCYLW